MRRRTRAAAASGAASRLAAAVGAVGLLAACTSGTPERVAAPKPTPLASFDGTVAHVERVSFCTRIPDAAVADVVGTEVTTAHYGNGEKLPGADDLGHEYGCHFTGTDGTVARSWVFVPPVTPERAGRLAAAARAMPGCAPTPAEKFGAPAVGSVCRAADATTVTYRGLFGDAWLSCSVSQPGAAPGKKPTAAEAEAEKALVAKAGTWCVQVATTAAAS